MLADYSSIALGRGAAGAIVEGETRLPLFFNRGIGPVIARGVAQQTKLRLLPDVNLFAV
jgi:hypothetical protein